MSRTTQAAVKEENSRLLREDLEQRRTVFRALPELVALHTTERCNLRCVMCVRSLGQGELQLSRTRLAEICDRLFPTAKKVALSAAAGEPVLADFDLVLEKALRHEVRVDLVTNGTALDGDVYRKAARAFDHLNVSIDCSVPEVYERIRVGGSFARLEANLRAIAEERRRTPDDVLFSLSAVVMRSTLPHLPDLVRFAAAVGANGVILERLYHHGKATPEEEPFTLPDGAAAVAAAFEAVRAAAREVGMSVAFSEFGEENLFLKPLREKVPALLLGRNTCWYVAQHLGVQPTGEAYPCFFPTDYILGNLLYQDVDEVWNGAMAQRLRREHFAGTGNLFCSGCVNAPHLRARRPAWLVQWMRTARMRLAHRRNRRERARRERAASAKSGAS